MNIMEQKQEEQMAKSIKYKRLIKYIYTAVICIVETVLTDRSQDQWQRQPTPQKQTDYGCNRKSTSTVGRTPVDTQAFGTVHPGDLS